VGAAWISSETLADESRFVDWAVESKVVLSTVDFDASSRDLAPFGRMVGEATLVALSEGTHGAAEPLEFRNRIFRYLVEEKGFTAIAIESGIVEGRSVHDYVRGQTSDFSQAMARGLGWTFERMPQNSALVRWLRDYNMDPRHRRKVNFYGFDVAGSPGNTKARRGADTALTEVLDYLARVDGASATHFHTRLDPLIANLKFATHRGADAPGYDRLSRTERDELTGGIADLITLLERNEARYTAASTGEDYKWAYRAAIGARQIDAWLRQLPVGWQATNDGPALSDAIRSFYSVATDVRDRAQADNLEWIVDQEGPGGKILVFAHRYHLSKTPLHVNLFIAEGSRQVPAGTYLHRRFGERLIAIAHLIGHGEAGCGSFNLVQEPAEQNSMEGLAGKLAAPLFLLDLRSGPIPVRNWLGQEYPLAGGTRAMKLPTGQAFDILFYSETVTRACPPQ
jgi:erythromycin esterase